MVMFLGITLASLFTLIKILELLLFVAIALFPVAAVVSISFLQVVLYTGIVLFVLLFIINYKECIEKFGVDKFRSIHIAFLIYIFSFALTKFVNSGLSEALDAAFSASRDYVIFLWLIMFVNDKRIPLVKKMILIAGILSVLYGCMQLFGLDIFNRQANPCRISGFHKNAYTYGGQLIIIFFFFLNEWMVRWPEPLKNSKDLIQRLAYLLLSFICFYCVLNTSERAVILGVVIGMILYIILSLKMLYAKKLLFPVLILMIVPAAITILFNRVVLQRIIKIISPKDHELTNIRFRLWDLAVFTWKKNIIFGTGNYPSVYHQATDYMPVQILTHAHNVFLQLLATNGLIGLISFINLIGVIVISLFKSIKSNVMAIVLICIIFSLLIEGVFEFNWGDVEVRYLFLYFIGYVFASGSNKSRDQEA